MTERDLQSLKDMAIPQARDNARQAALAAALKEFDDHQSALAANTAKSPSPAPKGKPIPFGQTETSNRKRRFFRMDFSSRTTQAVAASIAALVVVAPLAFNALTKSGLPNPGDFSALKTELPAPPPPVNVEATPQVSVRDAKDAVEAAAPPLPDADTARLEEGAAKAKKLAAPAGHETIDALERSRAMLAPAPGEADATSVAQQERRIASPEPLQRPDNSTLAPRAQSPQATVGNTAAPAPAKPDLSAATGRRAMQSDKYAAVPDLRTPPDPYASLGHTDEQKAITIEENRDKFESKEINPVKQAADEPVSTFSIDVDTASYSFVRRALNAGHLPPKAAVRVEEMINYFPYNYPSPESAELPFKPTVTVTRAPWNPKNKLVHIALQGYELKTQERPRANVVFLIDVSGSMEPQDRLPLVKNAFRMLVDELHADDTVGIVTYASGSGILLEPTKASDKGKILAAIDKLGAGGSTAGAAGIADAYRLAESNFQKNAVNRVILATDGDFNVGITNQEELKGFIERKRKTGIFLSILGVGQGNHNDALMQVLAQNGNGTAAYVDTLSEARKVLVEESSSTLFTIAKDVKVQVEWNPARVSEYRLIGYETRNLRREDFNNDRVDAGDIGSGHRVTAIYEVTPVGAPKLVDDLRYGRQLGAEEAQLPAAATAPAREGEARSGELGFLKLRYKRPNEETSKLIELAITDPAANNNGHEAISNEVRFSIAVAAFGQMLKGEPYTLDYSYDDVLKLAQDARGHDPYGYRAEFLNLVRLAKSARP